MITDSELIVNARKPFELNVSKGDVVTIVSDTGMDPRMWSVLNTAARSMGLEPTVALMPEPAQTQGNPPKQVEEAMLASDVCVMATSKASVHSEAAMKAQKQGIGLIAMEEITPQILGGEAASADYEAILDVAKTLEKKINDGDSMRVDTPAGTDLEASIEGRSGFGVAGKIEAHPGLPEFRIAAFPDGEVSISPVEGTSNGKIVWDTSMHEIGLLNNPIKAEVKNGFLTDISGGQEANQLRQMLESADNPDVYNLAEIAVGINPRATITGLMRQDKKAQGFIHMAVGANADTGGTVKAPLHIDGIAGGATVTVDGDPIYEDGVLVM